MGYPVVPLVKNMSIGSFPPGASGPRPYTRENPTYSLSKLRHPSRSPLTMSFMIEKSGSSFLSSASAISAWCATSPSAVQTSAFTSAALKRYVRSCTSSWLTAGITTAPILWSARIAGQYCQWRLRMNITLSPLPMPMERK